jgi:hypothetical protein
METFMSARRERLLELGAIKFSQVELGHGMSHDENDLFPCPRS